MIAGNNLYVKCAAGAAAERQFIVCAIRCFSSSRGAVGHVVEKRSGFAVNKAAALDLDLNIAGTAVIFVIQPAGDIYATRKPEAIGILDGEG